MQIRSAKDLIVYQKGYALAIKIFHVSKSFPAEEKYLLTDQIRRSSRSVCTNTRSMGEAQIRGAFYEQTIRFRWRERLDSAHECEYLSKSDHAILTEKCHEVGAMLGRIMNDPSSFILRSSSDL
jgi:23S rRNA-intervening sequence protein